MNSFRKTAIIVGVLFLTSTATMMLGSDELIGSILDDPDYLVNVSVNENQVIIGVLLELYCAAAVAGIAILMYPILKKQNEALSLGYVGFRIIEAVIIIFISISALSLLTLSREFVIAGAPDIPSAAIGSGAVRDYDTHIYIGTSDWVICHIPFKKVSIFHGIGAILSGIPGRYMAIDEQEIAGGALSFLRDKILYHKDELLKEEAVPDVYKIFDRMVENVPAGSNNLIFTPWLIGERTPVDDHTIRGGFYNLSLEMSREHLIRAIFEGVAYNINWVFIYLEKLIQKRKIKDTPGMTKKDMVIPEVSMIGGGATSNIWCQIFADVLNRTVKQVKDPIQANARGAAFIASVGLGYLTWDQIPDLIQYSNIFKPNPENRAVYDKLFNEFTNIYKIMKKTHKRLNS